MDASYKSMAMYREGPASLRDPNKQTQDAERQETGDEVHTVTMETSGMSVTNMPVAAQGGHEERTTTNTTSRQRGAETSKTPATRRRKRPISSLYNLDGWVNKTRGKGGGEEGTVIP